VDGYGDCRIIIVPWTMTDWPAASYEYRLGYRVLRYRYQAAIKKD